MASGPSPALTRHVDDLFPELEHLLEAADAVEATRGSLGWGAVQAVLNAEADAVNAPMNGSVKVLDQADYAARHGRIGGLKSAQEAADAIVAVAERRRVEQANQHEAGAETLAER